MRFPQLIAAQLLAVFACTAATTAVAGPFGDDMAKCLVIATSRQDRTALVKWIFAAVALHPDVAPLATISTQQREAINKAAGALFQHLLTESCKAETQAAIRNEGALTIQYAFQILGQEASRGLFTDPRVAESARDLAKYMDSDKLKALNPPPPAAPK